MIKRQERIERIRAVENEYRAAADGVRLLMDQLRADPNWGEKHGWRARDGNQLSENLESTYLIRLYAEFEAGLRDVWAHYFARTTHPTVRDLLIAIAGRRNIPQDWLEDADTVRLYRNAIVHEGSDDHIEALPLADARRHLCRYFSRLPEDW